MEQQNELTFSVRQLAVLFGRTEQTIRRWKDQGKLQAASDTDGTLVFTLDAVRELVRKNPRLLDKAAEAIHARRGEPLTGPVPHDAWTEQGYAITAEQLSLRAKG